MRTNTAAGTTYRFDEFEVDVSAYELRRGGTRIRLSRQPMELLLLLLERRHELVGRADIAKELWDPDVFTDADAGIHTAILKIRQALGDSRESPRFIETVAGKGYRFVGPVDVVVQSRVAASPGAVAAAEERASPRRHNLPTELTSFIGRQRELLDLSAVLASSRLLVLTGTGGVGKTRLALRLSSGVVHQFPDGVWLVELALLSAPDLLAQTIATTLGIRERPQRSMREAVLEDVHHRQLLLVLDNCEHLIDSCADLVEAMLRAAPGLRILATSRETLGASGEIVYRVPSLSLPADNISVSADAVHDSEATQLFIERARATDLSFVPNSDNADVIARICRRLDGIPLAIELAAARIVTLSVEQIETRLQESFRLLAGGGRTTVARQRTLEATIDWSYQLLSEVERQLLTRLSVFPAAWTLEAAEEVGRGDGINRDDVLDLLTQLVNKSLVVTDSEAAGERRYRFLETVRRFAGERLEQAGVADRSRNRHFDFFFKTFRGARPILRGRGQVALLRRLRIEEENVRAALEWGLTQSGLLDSAVELTGALFWFWTKRGRFHEGKYWLERALAAGGHVQGALRARALIGLAHMHYFQGTDSRDAITEALLLGREAGDPWVVSVALFIRGLSALERGDEDEALACAQGARSAADAGGGAVEHGGPLYILAQIAVAHGDYERAQHLYDESIEVHRQASEPWGLGIQLVAAAAMRAVRGDYGQARAQASEALSLFQELEDPRGIAWSLEVFAGVLAGDGQPNRAAALWGAAEELMERMGVSLPPNLRLLRELHAAPVQASLGGTRFEAARADGRAMSLGDAIAVTRHQDNTGFVYP